MGGLRSLKRSIARHPERVWLAKQNEKKQKQIALENDAKKKAEAEKLVADVVQAAKDYQESQMIDENGLPTNAAYFNPPEAGVELMNKQYDEWKAKQNK